MIATVEKTNGVFDVKLPTLIAEQIKLQDKSQVDIILVGDKIVISTTIKSSQTKKPHKTFKERLIESNDSRLETLAFHESTNGETTSPQHLTPPHKTLAERFDGYTGDYRGETLDWGEDVGGEIIDWVDDVTEGNSK